MLCIEWLLLLSSCFEVTIMYAPNSRKFSLFPELQHWTEQTLCVCVLNNKRILNSAPRAATKQFFILYFSYSFKILLVQLFTDNTECKISYFEFCCEGEVEVFLSLFYVLWVLYFNSITTTISIGKTKCYKMYTASRREISILDSFNTLYTIP